MKESEDGQGFHVLLSGGLTSRERKALENFLVITTEGP